MDLPKHWSRTRPLPRVYTRVCCLESSLCHCLVTCHRMQPSGKISASHLCLPRRFLRLLQLCHLPGVGAPQHLWGALQTPTFLATACWAEHCNRHWSPAADTSLCLQRSLGVTLSCDISDCTSVALASQESQCGMSGLQVSQPEAGHSGTPKPDAMARSLKQA